MALFILAPMAISLAKYILSYYFMIASIISFIIS